MRPAPWKILLATLIPILCALPAAAQDAPATDAAETETTAVRDVAPAAGGADRASEPATAAEGEAAEAPAAAAPPLALVVNIPAGRLDVLRDGEVVESFPVSVGTAKHPTLMGSYEVQKAVWNPWWHPPKSFWARNEKPTPPGPRNPMGRVKLFYEPLYFIHGTTEEGKLGRPASHGCVRMANDDVVALAMLLHEHTTPAIGRDRLEEIAAARTKTREIPFERTVPLWIDYELVEVAAGQIVVHPDVYRRGGGREQLAARIVDALAANGVAADTVDREQVALLADEAGKTGGSRPLAELVASSTVAAAAVGR